MVTRDAVLTKPVFTLQPASVATSLGERVVFTAAASGVPAPSLSWESNGEPVGVSGGTLVLDGVSVEDLMGPGVQCMATSSQGTVASAWARITLRDPKPVVLPGGDLPAAADVVEGTELALGVRGEGIAGVCGAAAHIY